MTRASKTATVNSSSVSTLRSPEPVLSVAYHIAALSLCVFTQVWAFTLAPPIFLLLMFTVWTGLIQLLYFLCYTAAALLSLSPSPSAAVLRLRQGSSLLLSSMFLCSLGTTLLFWSIFSYDPKLLVPPGFDYDLRLNHLQHSVPFLLSVVELLAFPHPEMSVTLDLAATLLFPVLYLCMLLVLFQSGSLPYLFMQQFRLWHLTAFVSTLMLLAVAVYAAYRQLRHWRWKEAKQRQHSKYA